MSKYLLVGVVFVLGLMVVLLLSQAGLQQARLEILYLQADRLQMQNNTLVARQAQLDSEKAYLVSQNQQMQQHLASYRAAYQQVREQNQRLQAIIDVTGRFAEVNWSRILWLGLIGLLVATTVGLTTFAIARHTILGPGQSPANQPEETALDDPWASPEYRHLAIQKARQFEQWERQSVLAYWNPNRVSMPSYQEITSTNLH